MPKPFKRTKKEELAEPLAFEQAIRAGICACLVNLVCEHARVVGGDQSKALADIRYALNKTTSSLKVQAKDSVGGDVEISEIIQMNVGKVLDQVFRNAEKRILKSVH